VSERIGKIELLRPRIYNLDAENDTSLATTVCVEAGEYDLYRDGFQAVFWLMRGKLNKRGFWREGDGMFAMHDADAPSDIEVVFPSRRFGPEEWADLLSSPEFTEGHEAQRLRATFDEPAVA
jgi:hypothetical protein